MRSYSSTHLLDFIDANGEFSESDNHDIPVISACLKTLLTVYNAFPVTFIVLHKVGSR